MPKPSRPKTLGLISLGCPKNLVDSERLLAELAEYGWMFTDDPSQAECLIVNTCGFINDAKLESYEALEEIYSIKKSRTDVILVATGCLPQRPDIDLKSAFPELDLVAGIGSLPEIPALLEKLWLGKKLKKNEIENLCIPGRATLSGTESPRTILTPPWTAYIKIAEGCSHECAFCIIPKIKGPHISRPPDDIIAEATELLRLGARELILVSQDTTAYGSDIGTNLVVLLSELDKIETVDPNFWIRIHYLYPSKISDRLIETIAQSKHILPYFDIPLQHVKPDILKRMNRLAPDTDLRALFNRIRKPFENTPTPACIRSTFIIGFPGETEDDVDSMEAFIEETRIDRLTVFRYSPEPGTTSYKLPDEVPDHIVDSRVTRIMVLQQDISLEINESWIGKEIDVILEDESDDGRLVGRSYRDAIEIDGLVYVSGITDNIGFGEIVRARVTGALPYDLEAEYIPCGK